MDDDGSPWYSIRDQTDPVFVKNDPAAEKRTAEARRLAGMVMGDEVQVQGNSWDLNPGHMKKDDQTGNIFQGPGLIHIPRNRNQGILFVYVHSGRDASLPLPDPSLDERYDSRTTGKDV